MIAIVPKEAPGLSRFVQAYGWIVIVGPSRGCFRSDPEASLECLAERQVSRSVSGPSEFPMESVGFQVASFYLVDFDLHSLLFVPGW